MCLSVQRDTEGHKISVSYFRLAGTEYSHSLCEDKQTLTAFSNLKWGYFFLFFLLDFFSLLCIDTLYQVICSEKTPFLNEPKC